MPEIDFTELTAKIDEARSLLDSLAKEADQQRRQAMVDKVATLPEGVFLSHVRTIIALNTRQDLQSTPGSWWQYYQQSGRGWPFQFLEAFDQFLTWYWSQHGRS